MGCVGDDGSHLLTNGQMGSHVTKCNVDNHLLHITYTTGVYAMYNTFVTRSAKRGLIAFPNCQVCLIITPHVFTLSPYYYTKP